MLDEKDLQAIAKLMDVKLTRQKQEIMHEVGALIEADVLPKFNLLADGQKLIREQMVTRDDLADLESRLDVLEAVTPAERPGDRQIEKGPVNRMPFRPSRKTLLAGLGVFLLLVYSVTCMDYFEETDKSGTSKGIIIYPFYEHIEIYSHDGAQFPFGIDSIQLTKTPFASTTYCQNSEKASIAKYHPFSKKLSVQVYRTGDRQLISADKTPSLLPAYTYSEFFSPLLCSENTATNMKLHTKFGDYQICTLNAELFEHSQQ